MCWLATPDLGVYNGLYLLCWLQSPMPRKQAVRATFRGFLLGWKTGGLNKQGDATEATFPRLRAGVKEERKEGLRICGPEVQGIAFRDPETHPFLHL